MDQHPDFKSILLTRHDAADTICVSGYKMQNGKFVVSERFCNGVDEVANLIERSYMREDIGAIWTNLQRLKPGSHRRKKGETIDAYTNLLVDIDRKWKMIHDDGTLCQHENPKKEDCGAFKANATEEERELLREVAEQVQIDLAGLGSFVVVDSGNGFHVSLRCEPMEPRAGEKLYKRVLEFLRQKFERPGWNMEIDVSLVDETQVVTVPGTFNRKYPHLLDRPQRQSKIVYMSHITKTTGKMNPARQSALEHYLDEKAPGSKPQQKEETATKRVKGKDVSQADPDWLENYGVPDLVEFWSPEITYEEDSYDKGGDTHHPIHPCPCHEGEDFHEHSHPRDCEIIEFADGGVGISCFSGELSLKQVIAKMNAIKGENYPHCVFAEESDEEIAKAFGVESADAVPTPVGEVCYKQGGCGCGGVHVQYKKDEALPQGVDLREGERSLVKRKDENGVSHLIGIPLSEVQSRSMKFLWPGRIPMGKGVIAAGPPGKGKSTAVLEIAARITTGADFPDGAKNELGPRTVLWAGTEDDLEDTVKPKLQALGADLTKFIALKRVVSTEGGASSRRLLLQRDIKLLYKMLNENPDVAMVIFDPITGFYGGADGNSSKEIRPIMEALAEVCRNTGVVVVAIMHENRRKDVTALERVLGSGAVGQVFRAGFRFSDDPKNKGGFIMACSKTNFKIKGGLRYTITDADPVKLDDGTVATEIGKVVWGEKHDMTADDVIQQATEEAETGFADDSVVGKAVKIFQEALADGKAHRCPEVHALLDAAKIDKNARNKARYRLGVKTLGKAPGPYWWVLPKPGVDLTEPNLSKVVSERMLPDTEEL